MAKGRGLETPPNQCVKDQPRVHNDRIVRQVKGVRDRLAVIRVILLAAVTLYPAVADFAQGAEPEPAKLQANTLEAFDRYVKLTEARNNDELKRGTNLLWIDQLPAAQRTEAYAALKRGEVKMKKLEMLPSFRVQVLPRIPLKLGKHYVALAAAHATLGSVAEILAVYILLAAGTRLLPEKMRIARYKAWMQCVFALCWLALLLGFATYIRWYVLHSFR